MDINHLPTREAGREMMTILCQGMSDSPSIGRREVPLIEALRKGVVSCQDVGD